MIAGHGEPQLLRAAESVMADLRSRHGVRILIIDACRSRPGTEMIESLQRPGTRALRGPRGLAQVQPKNVSGGMYIAFAAEPGQEADDGVRSNSPFTGALLKHLHTPGLDVDQLFTLVRAEVFVDTSEKQRPESVNRLTAGFMFKAVR